MFMDKLKIKKKPRILSGAGFYLFFVVKPSARTCRHYVEREVAVFSGLSSYSALSSD